MNRFFRSAFFPLIVIAAVAYLAVRVIHTGSSSQKVTLSQVYQYAEQHQLNSVVFQPNKQEIDATRKSDGAKITVNYPTETSATQFLNLLRKNDIPFDSGGIGSSPWWGLLTGILPFVLLIAFWIFLMNQVQGGGSKVMSFGKSRAKRMTPDSPKIGFKDVAGVDEAVEELQEIKEFLENPKKFQALGARIPKGVLLYGPPGTGKTLLARAVAGEAGVPFFSISGSDFVEMFVGVGASRVRDLFEQAKQASPCIVFMDEIDA
ncbi:MAG TPA: ATP-dependent metallopeptidase FtsH/Yme1/Tma family protein, partial [Gaiellaceae bacterium]